MWIIAGSVTIEAARREAYVTAHQDLVRRGREADGCLDLAISEDPLDPNRINVYERWESWDAIEAWRAVANAPDTGTAVDGSRIKAYEVGSEREPF
ncbi:MAG TPA: antibiotic biosynthesis monooxygenase family protein [Mycobacteriales bacterium]